MKIIAKKSYFSKFKRFFRKDIPFVDRLASILTVIIWVSMFVFSISFLLIYIWSLMTSFNTVVSFGLDPFAFPEPFTLQNYSNAFINVYVSFIKDGIQYKQYIEQLLSNTIIYIAVASLVATFTPCFVAYVASQYDFKFNAVLDGVVVVSIILPIVNATPSEITMLKTIRLYDSYLGLAFMRMTFLGTTYLIFKSAFKGIDKAYREAAEMDGAGNLTVMFRIQLPMISNITLIMFIQQVMAFWGDWQFPLVFLPTKPTVAYGLYQLQFTHEPELIFEGIKFAACFMASIPTLILFVIFKDKMMGGLSFGGVKG